MYLREATTTVRAKEMARQVASQRFEARNGKDGYLRVHRRWAVSTSMLNVVQRLYHQTRKGGHSTDQAAEDTC